MYKDGSGVPNQLKVYLAGKGILRSVAHYSVGKCFHILFHNGGAVHYITEILLEFLNRVCLKPYLLLQAVNNDLRNPVLVDAILHG